MMRRFSSYGPVDETIHFAVPRKSLVASCMENLIGHREKGGHYFTIWAPRQCGKTWLMQQVIKYIREQYADQFEIFSFSLGVLRGEQCAVSEKSAPLPRAFSDLLREKLPGKPDTGTWGGFRKLFSKENGLWDRPLLLFIDEVDTVSPDFLDILIGQFREMYLDRESNLLHGLALIGVHAVLGTESERGSPFNIQRSLHVPNFAKAEVEDLFRQYQKESGQKIEDEVVGKVYEVTRGQPGLTCWFGELLTEKYNPGKEKIISTEVWNDTFRLACAVEWNNTVLNIIKKAKGEYQAHILELFTRADIPFSIDSEWCSYLYLHGIIDTETVADAQGRKTEICRFANPFMQHRLYNALSNDLTGGRLPILAIEPLDRLEDVFESPELNIPALLERYRNYLKRLKAKGINPWKDQPRRADLHYTEYVGHFHLYFWLQNAVGRQCSISPEFPTGNGRVDLHLRCRDRQSVIEVKSFKNQMELDESRKQAARYARKLNLPAITLAVFVPVEDEKTLVELSDRQIVDNITVTVVAIGWV
ncbi:MAG: hypothetical protein AB7S75_20640 [Desulfococcaceae bacterium]